MTATRSALVLAIGATALAAIAAGTNPKAWADFMSAPGQRTYAKLERAVQHDGCDGLDTYAAPKLFQLIESGNALALQAGLLALPCMGVGDSEDFSRSAGMFLELKPNDFLRISGKMAVEDAELKYMSVMLPLDLEGSARVDALQKRKGLVERVDEPALQATRALVLRFLGKSLESEAQH